YLGCYTDGGGGEGHTLQGKSLIDDDDMTKELCQAFCASWPYFGMEYGKECYCGNAILNGAPDLESTCNVPCEGNTSQTCGGGGHMSIYYDSSVPGPSAPAVFNGANFIGCYVELQQVRVLDNGGVTSETAMDLTVCSNYCYNLSPTRDWWGLENAKECWCAFDINPNAVLASNPDGCGQACTGNDTQLCGGINLVAVYQRP
ncbi:WSC domain containing protein, partial [Naviculisporaceae sp. PSN 640]